MTNVIENKKITNKNKNNPMKKIIIIVLAIVLCTIEGYPKGGGSHSSPRSSSPKTSNSGKNSPKSSSTKSTRSSRYDGGSKGSVRGFCRKSAATTGIKAGATKAPSYRYGKTFAKPKTIKTSTRAHHPVEIIYTRPVYFISPYRSYYYMGSGPSTSPGIDTNAFPGFGKGQSGGAGASTVTKDLNHKASKDSLSDIMELQPINYVSDFAGVIPDADEPKINSMIRQYKKLTGVEIAIVTIPSLGEEVTVDDFAQLLFDKWGIGEKDINNGILLLVTTENEDGQIHLRLQPGYGLEELITDAFCRRIEDDQMVPEFSNDKWESGIIKGIAAIKKELGTSAIEATKDAYKKKKAQEAQKAKDNAFIAAIVIASIIVFIILVLISRRRWKNRPRIPSW